MFYVTLIAVYKRMTKIKTNNSKFTESKFISEYWT